ncbi:MAG: 23S rRNA (pseudouridine(1915)-N(3))-methyltransferase RlmH [Pseudomonadota bacterium]
MKLRLLAVGQKMPGWVQSGYEEYARRMPPHLALELIEIAPGRRGRNADVARAMQSERDTLLSHCPGGHCAIALDVRGKPWPTEALAANLADWMQDGRNVDLLIGGPDGLHPDCLARAERRWSLGPLTLPHPLVRIVLAEQLYRAWTILDGHPYHRA